MEINQELFFASTDEERIQMLQGTKGPVIFRDVQNTGEVSKLANVKPDDRNWNWYFWHSCHSFHFRLRNDTLLCSKYFQAYGTCDGKDVSVVYDIVRYTRDCHSRSENIIKMTQSYTENGWMTETLARDFVIAIFSYGDFVYPRTTELYQYALTVAEQHGIDLQEIASVVYQNKYTRPICTGQLVLFKAMLDKGLPILHASKQLSMCPCVGMFDFCIQNELSVVSDMQGLKAIIERLDEERAQRAIRQYREAGALEPDSKYYSKLILKCPALVDDNNIDETVLDAVLFDGSLPLIKDLLSRGFQFIQKEYRLYVPCPECYNGESHPCNDRYVNTDFVSRVRFGVCTGDLTQATDEDSFWVAYGHFDGPADDAELYTAPGVEEQGWNGDTEQRIFRVPPTRVERAQGPAQPMHNNIPCVYVQI